MRIWVSTERSSGSPALEGVVELGEDGLELADATAVEQQREGAEDLFDLRVAAGAVQADDVAVRQLACARFLGVLELDELLAQKAGLTDLGPGVVRKLDVPWDLDRDLGDVALELDVLTLPTVTSLTLTVDCGHEVEDVAEHHVIVIGLSPVSAPPGRGAS